MAQSEFTVLLIHHSPSDPEPDHSKRLQPKWIQDHLDNGASQK